MSLSLQPHYHPTASDEIKGLQSQIRKRIQAAIEKIGKNPSEGKPLKGKLSGFRSLRVGDYRIIYTIESSKNLLYILYVGHRSKVYEDARRKL